MAKWTQALDLLKDIFSNAAGELVAGVVIVVLLKLRNRTVQLLRKLYSVGAVIVTRRRWVLVWNDVDIRHSIKLVECLKSEYGQFRFKAIRAPIVIRNFHLYPGTVAAIVLIDADVSKFVADSKERGKLQRQLVRYLMRGGGLVGTHDVIYTRVRNDQLQNAFGAKITEFRRTEEPVVYCKTAAAKEHEMTRLLPERLALDDGEIVWGNWATDVVVHYSSELTGTPVVTSREYFQGRLVWLNSGDKRHSLAGSLAKPEDDFVALLAASVRWVARSAQMKSLPKRLVVAHRGASVLARENTIQAFTMAIETKSDMVELDVHRTGDGIYVVHHDPDLSGPLICDLSLADVQSKARELGYEMPELRDVMKLCKGRIRLDVELKEEGYEIELVDFIREHLSDEQFVITSFSDRSIRKIKMRYPGVRCGLLLGVAQPDNAVRTRLSELFPVGRMLRCGADFVAPHFQLIRFGFSRRLRSFGFPIWVWTVDDPRLMRRLLKDRSVEAVITNAPDLALKEIGRIDQEAQVTFKGRTGTS